MIVERPCALAVEGQRHELLLRFVAQLAPYRVVAAGFAEANILPRVIYGQMFEGNIGHARFILPAAKVPFGCRGLPPHAIALTHE